MENNYKKKTPVCKPDQSIIIKLPQEVKVVIDPQLLSESDARVVDISSDEADVQVYICKVELIKWNDDIQNWVYKFWGLEGFWQEEFIAHVLPDVEVMWS